MKKYFLTFFCLALLALTLPHNVSAFQIQDIPGSPVEGNFIVGPGKQEFILDKGQTAQAMLMVTNRFGEDAKFLVEIEDISGSLDPENGIMFLGDQKGPYSLKDSVKPEVKEFSLKQGQRITLPVLVSIPEDAEPGGRYGSVIVSRIPDDKGAGGAQNEVGTQTKIITRIASAFYVRVKGLAQEAGALKKFIVDNKEYIGGGKNIDFKIYFQNDGNVHLKPQGRIEIRNMLGNKIFDLDVKQFFVLPQSYKLVTQKWEPGFLMGYYTATISLSRGYNDANGREIVDKLTTGFWVVKWPVLAIALLIILALSFIIYWFGRNFEIKKK